MEFLISIVILLLSYTLIRAIFIVFGVAKPNNLPPGPVPVPIVGNLHLLGTLPHRSLAKLVETYGPIMCVKLGQITTLVISSAAAAKEVLQTQDFAFSTRHIPDALHARHYARHSVSFLPVGAEWRTLRRIINSNISSGKSLDANQHLRTKLVNELVEHCKKASTSNDHVDIGRGVFRTSLNLISNAIFSKDLADPYEEDSGKEFKEVVGNMMVEAGKPNLVDFFPGLRRIDPQGIRRRLTRHYGKLLDIFDELVRDRMRSETRLKQDDLLDVCLKLSLDDSHEINRSHIDSLFLDLFVAGTDTTSNTIEWAMAELLRNPYIMAKAKKELDEVIGKGKTLKEDDVSRLPYLSCIVKETLRMYPPLPLLLPRKVETQVKLDEYTIPKGTRVLVNAWAIGRDETIWEASHEFKPERFLGSRLDVRGQDFELIPFGAGRRICPGLPLAIRMLPVILGSLLNNFDWNLDGLKELDMTERFGITLQKADPLCVVPVHVKNKDICEPCTCELYYHPCIF